MQSIEIIAVIVSLGYVVFNARQHIITWSLGLIGSCCYVAIFYHAGLYASMSLSVLFCLFMVYGWYVWKTGKQGAELPVTCLTGTQRVVAVLISALLTPSIYYFCTRVVGEAIPFADAAIAGFSLVAQYLAARKKLEAWYGWLGVNSLAVYVYATYSLWGTAVLYIVYIGFSAYGLREWKRSMLGNTPSQVTAL